MTNPVEDPKRPVERNNTISKDENVNNDFPAFVTSLLSHKLL